MFIHLHNHSEFSLLNGAIRISDLVKKAKEYGMPAVALTDYGNMFGAVEFFLEAKKAGIKPLMGCVVFHPSNDDHTLRQHRRGMDYLFQLVLLIQNKKGYQNLCQLISRSYLEGFYYKPRIDSKLLAQYSEGLIALSGGWDGAINHYLFDGQKEKASAALKQYAEIFPGRFYLELQENGVEGQNDINRQLISLGKEFNLPVVATNNCHYLTREDAEAFETLLCIQTGGTLHGANDAMKYSTDGYFFKSPSEVEENFAYCPEAIATTETIANLCDFEFDLKSYYFPKFTPPEGKTLDEFLVEEAVKGLEERWGEILKNRKMEIAPPPSPLPQVEGEREKLKKQYSDRLHLELDMIQKMGFAGYFLIVSDFIKFAKNNGVPVGPGRGSAAGSLVAYCTRITDIDPLPYNLLFERFLNPERVSMPDVDIDFCMHGRDRVLKYVAEKYGNVSQIITFGKMKAKAVLRDVGRVMEMPYEEVDKIAKLVPNALQITLKEALEQEPRLKDLVKNNTQVARLLEIAQRLEGLSRHASTHAAGVVISDRPLTDFLPLYKGGNNDVVTQFDMKWVEKIGLIKFDFLGLKTLTVIQDALKIIKRTRGIDLEILNIPLDDPAVYNQLSIGDTKGVFQLESAGMKDILVRMKPSVFEDLVALVALYRPGPLGSGMVDDFINRKQGKIPIAYDLPQLKGILEETYGVILYQEQVMQISSLLAGYSLGEADILRRAMGKKKPEEMIAQRVRFLKGCAERKIPQAKAEKIFDLMAKFAEYGFNKSHSAAYALVSYQTAYLKTHYTVEYLAAVLSFEMHDTDRVLYYIQDCEAHKIKILSPDVNESFFGFSVTGSQEIRFGLGAVKGIGEGAIESIVEQRSTAGPYSSFFNFCESIDMQKVNRRVIESLVKCGAFDSLDKRRAALFSVIPKAMELATKKRKEEGSGQTNLFGLMQNVDSPPIGITIPDDIDWSENQKLALEKEALGFYWSGHPLKSFEGDIRRIATTDTELCKNLSSEKEVILAGIVASTKVITTKKGARMAFVTFEDLRSSVEVIVFSDVFQKCVEFISQDKPLILIGTIDRAEDGVKILAKDFVPFADYLKGRTKSVHFKIPAPLITEDRFKAFHTILHEFAGPCSSYLHVIEPGETETVMELSGGVNLESQEALQEKINRLFGNKVVEYRG